ncbi:hypothetical protein WDU94_007022 [Cyamophila willieti]
MQLSSRISSGTLEIHMLNIWTRIKNLEKKTDYKSRYLDFMKLYRDDKKEDPENKISKTNLGKLITNTSLGNTPKNGFKTTIENLEKETDKKKYKSRYLDFMKTYDKSKMSSELLNSGDENIEVTNTVDRTKTELRQNSGKALEKKKKKKKKKKNSRNYLEKMYYRVGIDHLREEQEKLFYKRYNKWFEFKFPNKSFKMKDEYETSRTAREEDHHPRAKLPTSKPEIRNVPKKSKVRQNQMQEEQDKTYYERYNKWYRARNPNLQPERREGNPNSFKAVNNGVKQRTINYIPPAQLYQQLIERERSRNETMSQNPLEDRAKNPNLQPERREGNPNSFKAVNNGVKQRTINYIPPAQLYQQLIERERSRNETMSQNPLEDRAKNPNLQPERREGNPNSFKAVNNGIKHVKKKQ